MKVKTNSQNLFRRMLCMSLALVAVLSLLHPITAEAAKSKKKNITLKYQTYTQNKSVADKKASVVKTGYTYTITMKKKNGDYYGYVKFTAPKTKTYTLTFSDVKLDTKKLKYAYIHPEMQDSMNKKKLNVAYIKVKGHEKTTISLCSSKKGIHPTKVTGKIDLRKGQVLYLRYNFGYSSDKDKKVTSKLVIK